MVFTFSTWGSQMVLCFSSDTQSDKANEGFIEQNSNKVFPERQSHFPCASQPSSGSLAELAAFTTSWSTASVGNTHCSSSSSWSCRPAAMMTWGHCWASCTLHLLLNYSWRPTCCGYAHTHTHAFGLKQFFFSKYYLSETFNKIPTMCILTGQFLNWIPTKPLNSLMTMSSVKCIHNQYASLAYTMALKPVWCRMKYAEEMRGWYSEMFTIFISFVRVNLVGFASLGGINLSVFCVFL